MADFRRNNRGGGNRSFGQSNYGRERKEMYSATCANCGKQCEVPFRPTGNKPVLCRDCFQNNRGGDSRSEQRFSDRPRFERNTNQNEQNYQAQFDALNAKLDQILGLLAPQPVDTKPLESEISVATIDEIAKEVQEANEEKTVKKKKAKKTSSKKK